MKLERRRTEFRVSIEEVNYMNLDINRKRPDKFEKAGRLILTLLQIQLTFCKGNFLGIFADNWALGYIFGFHDSFTRAMGITDQNESIKIFKDSYEKLFNNARTASDILRLSLGLQHEQLFSTGVLEGGQEVIHYLKEGCPPIALAKHLRMKSSGIYAN